MGHAAKDSRIGNFISVQIENRQYNTVCNRIDEFIALPGRSKRSRFGFPVTYDSSGNQVGGVKNSAACMGNRIAQFAAFMDGTRRFRCTVAGHAAWEGKLFEQFLHPCFILRNIRIDFTIRSIQIIVGNKEISAMTRPG